MVMDSFHPLYDALYILNRQTGWSSTHTLCILHNLSLTASQKINIYLCANGTFTNDQIMHVRGNNEPFTQTSLAQRSPPPPITPDIIDVIISIKSKYWHTTKKIICKVECTNVIIEDYWFLIVSYILLVSHHSFLTKTNSVILLLQFILYFLTNLTHILNILNQIWSLMIGLCK